MSNRKRYAVVGLGGRSAMFTDALWTDYKDQGELVAYCDINQTRMDYYNRVYKERFDAVPVPTYKPADFEIMIRECHVDCVIVTTIDRTHHQYIIRALHAGCDAITEKPMTIDAEKCQAILDAVKATGKNLIVTFNYRYAPRSSKVKELLMQGVIGDIVSVHFEWLLDTMHGADYFRRWHRDKRNSGGLMVHKATHHFDLVNWWLDSQPATVFGFGKLAFYGRDNAEARGITDLYYRAYGSPAAQRDPFALHMENEPVLKGLYLDAEKEDAYLRDRSVFSDGISIEDDMAVLVRYTNGATMTYHLTAYSPWEGYRIAFNGTAGRLEFEVHENSYVSGAVDDTNQPEARDAVEIHEPATIWVRPHWKKPYVIDVDVSEGGHGGGDARLLKDVFLGAGDDPLGRAANHEDGARSILTGIAANQSFATGLPVKVADLVSF